MNNSVSGIILAGGLARRMRGKDKGLIKLCGKPLIEYAINNLEPQV
ncbi:MAG: NTP transferase domain-containing protein, partial [Proteobacteria bacterium]|nr:NTP transferase domain-containing protein [Pseudomonadota bacterium]